MQVLVLCVGRTGSMSMKSALEILLQGIVSKFDSRKKHKNGISRTFLEILSLDFINFSHLNSSNKHNVY